MNYLNGIILKNAFRKDNDNKKLSNRLLSFLVFIIIFGSISSIMGVASYKLTKQLMDVNQTPAFINIILLITILFLFSRSVFESLNNLYFSKDLKIFLKMPVENIKLVRAKINNMIISEYITELMIMLSPILVYGYLIKATPVFYIYCSVILLLLPVIPIVLTSLITALIMRFTNLIKNKSHVQYISIFIVFLILGGIISLFSTGERFSEELFTEKMLQANGLVELVSDYFIILKPIMNSIINYQNISGLQNLLIFALQSIVLYYLITWIISKIYLKGAIGATINVANRKEKINTTLKLSDFKQKSPRKAYLEKEFKQIARTPIFSLQCLILPILYPILGGTPILALIIFARNIGVDFFAGVQQRLLDPIGIVICLSIAQVLYMMNFTSITAISREGKTARLMKSIPISLYNQFRYKIYPGLVANGLTTILITICYTLFITDISMSFIIALFIILMELCLIEEKLMILVDLKEPKITWTSEYTMMKENMNVMYELFYAIFVIVILAFIGVLIRNTVVLMSLLMWGLFFINIAINRYVKKNQIKLYKKVY